jgi:hypothetical protein
MTIEYHLMAIITMTIYILNSQYNCDNIFRCSGEAFSISVLSIFGRLGNGFPVTWKQSVVSRWLGGWSVVYQWLGC